MTPGIRWPTCLSRAVGHRRGRVSLLFKAWTPGSRSWGMWFWGNELILTPGNAMPPCPWRPRLVLATALSRATRRYECPPASQRWLSSYGSSRACLGSLPLSETQAQPLTWRTGVRWGADQGRVLSYHLLPPPARSILASLRQGWGTFISAKRHLDITSFMGHTKLAT